MKIIVISREFGSGGRELGKRLSDILGFDYYDKEIIQSIAEKKGLSETYVSNVLENHGWQQFHLNYGTSFVGLGMFHSLNTELLIEQKEVIEKIAKAGKDCIIVGRNADVLLSDYHPFNIFVCASMESKIKRCMSRLKPGEEITEKELRKKIKKIDKGRYKVHELICDLPWGDRHGYNLTVNTTGVEIKSIAPIIADVANAWFKQNDK